ncbi:MAG: response regulator transcription factor [Magnetococcales bacterium]|nr:response regulator transcription factor [Magnetococcales bacterium]MBF0156933.1 response regulator transcription factor [Magnetococcales bacterium]
MRLLLVEDDPRLGKRLRDELTRSGYATDVAVDGVEAEFLGLETPYDLILLDLGLPGKSGLEVLRHWRAGGVTTPVIILTARDSWQEKVEGFHAGADDYLSKPFHTAELLARIQAVSRRGKAPLGGPLRHRELALDEEHQTVTVAGERIILTGTEFRLLRYFMLNPGKILSKSRLSEHLYEDDRDKDSNVLEVYIRRLRQKLGEGIIATRRGQGYLFGEEVA